MICLDLDDHELHVPESPDLWDKCELFPGVVQEQRTEVRNLTRIVSRDVRSVTCRNVMLLSELTGLSPWDYSKWRIQEKFRKAAVPQNDEWRPGLLLKLLDTRRDSLQYHNQLDKIFL